MKDVKTLLKALKGIAKPQQELAALAEALPGGRILVAAGSQTPSVPATLAYLGEFPNGRGPDQYVHAGQVYAAVPVASLAARKSVAACPLTGLAQSDANAPVWTGVSEDRLLFAVFLKRSPGLSRLVANPDQVADDFRLPELPLRYSNAHQLFAATTSRERDDLRQSLIYVQPESVRPPCEVQPSQVSMRDQRLLLSALYGVFELVTLASDIGVTQSQIPPNRNGAEMAAFVLEEARKTRQLRLLWTYVAQRYPSRDDVRVIRAGLGQEV